MNVSFNIDICCKCPRYMTYSNLMGLLELEPTIVQHCCREYIPPEEDEDYIDKVLKSYYSEIFAIENIETNKIDYIPIGIPNDCNLKLEYLLSSQK